MMNEMVMRRWIRILPAAYVEHAELRVSLLNVVVFFRSTLSELPKLRIQMKDVNPDFLPLFKELLTYHYCWDLSPDT